MYILIKYIIVLFFTVAIVASDKSRTVYYIGLKMYVRKPHEIPVDVVTKRPNDLSCNFHCQHQVQNYVCYLLYDFLC